MFDARKVKDDCVEWIREFFAQNGPGCNAVIGISGGKDSSVAAALCVEALGKDRVIGVLMPQGEQHDIDAAYMLVNHLGIRHFEVNVKAAVDGVLNSFPAEVEITPQTRQNIPPRVRMTTLYAISQSMNGRVVNTCNLSEDWVGYSTRYGDAAGDFSPMSNLTVTEVKAIGRVLGLPAELVDKTPIDGLCGKTDEENLGFTYAELDDYIRNDRIADLQKKDIIDNKHRANLFKLSMMPIFRPEPYYEENPEKKYLSLTFDDGPAEPMNEMVDKIKAYGWKAGFAINGAHITEKTLPMLRYAIDNGFQLVTHGQAHRSLREVTSKEEILAEMLTPVETVEKQLGYRMTMGRLPGLATNETVLQTMAQQQIPLLGQGIVCGQDWDPRSTPESIAEMVLATVTDGAIGTVHVRPNTCKALDIILPELQKRGYELVTPEELFRIRGVKEIPLGEQIRFVR